MLIGHMARLWHRWCRQDRVAQHVDIFGNLRLMGQKINLAPALVGCGQTGLDGNIACPHGRQDIEDRGLHVVTELEFQGVGERVDIDEAVFGAVLHDALVALGPCLLEEWPFRSDIVVGVQHQYLAARLGLAEIVGHLASPLIGAGGAAVGRQWNRQSINTAIGHGLELPSQGEGLRTGFPGVQHRVLRTRPGHAGQGIHHHVDPRGEDQAVIRQLAATGQLNDAPVGVYAGDQVTQQVHTVPFG